eukprot:TRINITY_DN7283_c0_g1_i2.p1 TRINITY_DN7283_c0_g1~~TRINITY_DN7283_c0_g1_i2.p1  ORF type:complete len:478 (+),score=118.58 TRINITY_DN7283_c0_g1_i2:166-1434(+)
MCTTDRKVSPIGKSTLFTVPVLGALLRALGAVPVRRRQDYHDQVQNNSAAIDAMASILVRGDGLCIFPEGISHDAPEIHDLKTGFARAAMSAANTLTKDASSHQVIDEEHIVAILPVGLNYMDKDRFRSSVFVEYGAPLWITAKDVKEASVSEDAEHTIIKRITAQLRQRMDVVTLTAPSWDELRVLYLAQELYLSSGAHTPEPEHKGKQSRPAARDVAAMAHRFLEVYKNLKNDPEIASLFRDVNEYRSQLDLMHLRDSNISTLSVSRAVLVFKLVRSVIGLALLFPVSLPGLIVHGPLGILCHYLAGWMSKNQDHPEIKDKDQLAHFKIMSAMVLAPILYILIGIAVGFTSGARYIFPTLVTIFISGWIAISYRPFTTVANALSVAAKLMLIDIKTLKSRRRMLQQRVVHAVQKHASKSQ